MRRTIGTLAAVALGGGLLVAVPSSSSAAVCTGFGVPATCTAPTAVSRSVSPTAVVIGGGPAPIVTMRAVFQDPDDVLGAVTFRNDQSLGNEILRVFAPKQKLSGGQRVYEQTYVEQSVTALGTRTVTVTGALRPGVTVSGFVAPKVVATYSVRLRPRVALFRDTLRSSATKVKFGGYLTGPSDNGGLKIKIQKKTKGKKTFVTKQVVRGKSGTTAYATKKFSVGKKKSTWRAVFAGKGVLLAAKSTPVVRVAP
jgi:hypothetical protein